jgi:CheY-like chemotaxis protein
MALAAVTGYGQSGDRARAAEAGFDHFLVKPLAADALLKFIHDQFDAD